jgi:glycosyltransferase involved in cell wall biosynthesis
VLPGLEARTRQGVALDDLARELRPDIVHVHNLMNPEALAWAADGGRALLSIQDHRFFCPTRGKWKADGRVCREAMSREACASCFEDEVYFRDVLALTFERLQAARRLPVVVLSRYMREELVAAGLSPDGVTVIPPFVHGLDPQARPDGPPCVLFVGRLVESKGVGDAVEAWRRSGVDLPLVIAGRGPLRESLGGAGVERLGWVPRARLGAVYARASALLMPSRWQEPFGIAGLEALHFGIPVVAWESGGIAEWHPGGDLLVPWGDVDALAAALRLAVTRRASRPPGFEREGLMARLTGVYERLARGESPATGSDA